LAASTLSFYVLAAHLSRPGVSTQLSGVSGMLAGARHFTDTVSDGDIPRLVNSQLHSQTAIVFFFFRKSTCITGRPGNQVGTSLGDSTPLPAALFRR